MNYLFTPKRPDTAYLTNNLLLPKGLLASIPTVKAALTFIYGEEDVVDSRGVVIRRRTGTIELWDETEHHLVVPREFLPADQYPKFCFPFHDLRPTDFERVDIEENIHFRDNEQESAFQALMMHQGGTLNLNCGRGKTVIALKLAGNLKVPTIVIVNSTALLEQWKEEICNHLKVRSIGTVQGELADWQDHPIVVAMIHTLSSRVQDWPYEFRRRFGLSIWDECFPAGTLIGDTPIEKIQIGDLIPSYDQTSHQIVAKKVIRTFQNSAIELVEIWAGDRVVTCTPNHPFLTDKGWVEAQKLITLSTGPLQILGVTNGSLEWLRVVRIGFIDQECPVYNLEVEDNHTYLANGLVAHNCHHVSAPTFVKSADLFYGRRYSLTATATRTDGLESIYQYHLGRVIHTNLNQDLVPTTYIHVLKWEIPVKDRYEVEDCTGDVNINKVRTYLGRQAWRNQLIYEDILADLADGRSLLVLSHSIEHVNQLHAMLSSSGSGLITGATPQEDRMAILRECNPVFGTFQLAREGLNKPSLDTLFVVTPFGNSNDLQQAWGRIQRQYSNKKPPIVRFYEDHAFTCCTRAGRTVRRILTHMDYPFKKIVHNVEAL